MFKNKTFHKGFPKFDAGNDGDDDGDIEDADVHDTDTTWHPGKTLELFMSRN